MTVPIVPTPTVQVEKNRTWRNWHESVKQKVAQLVTVWNVDPGTPTIASYNATTAAIQRLIGEAASDGLELRAAGGTWSFTPVAATGGILINTRPLNFRFWPSDGDLHERWQGRAASLVFAQCGMSISELNASLRLREKSLRTSGASNGQTIAGAIGTGTHGSAIDQGAINDSVVALHVVTTKNRHLWIERASEPVASEAFRQSLGAELLADDDAFDAALVSFGSFGIVHGVMLEVDDLFWLQEYRRQYAESPDVRAVIDGLDFASPQLPRPGVRPYFFQALFNSTDRASGPYLTLMYRSPDDPGGPRPEHDDKWRPGDSAAELVTNLIELSGGTPKALTATLFRQLYPDVNGECGTWGEMFWDTSSRGRLASTAIGLASDRLAEAVELLYELNARHKAPVIFAVRYVRRSRGTLAFTNHADVTCVLEADGPYSKRMRDFYESVWGELVTRRIPHTFHWGKMHGLDAAGIVKAYGRDRVNAWRVARRRVLGPPAARAVFENDFLRHAGLAG